jgi:hypothetical protein
VLSHADGTTANVVLAPLTPWWHCRLEFIGFMWWQWPLWLYMVGCIKEACIERKRGTSWAQGGSGLG